MVTCPVSMACPRMKSALATDASPATAASEPGMRRGPSILEMMCMMEDDSEIETGRFESSNMLSFLGPI